MFGDPILRSNLGTAIREPEPEPPAQEPPSEEPPVRDPSSGPMRREPPQRTPPVEEPPASDPARRSQVTLGVLREYRACLACGSERLIEVCSVDEMRREKEFRERFFRVLSPEGTPGYMLKDRAYPTQMYEARLVACEACGTLARDPHLSAHGSLREYAEDEYHPDWLERSFHEFRTSFEQRMPALVRRVGRRARVLEVGSFVGGFLAAARAQGWQAQGIDVGECVVAFSRSKGLDVRHGTLCGTRLPARSFDAVFVWFCFDQLPAPVRDLEEIHRLLKDSGQLLIRVPNGDFVRFMQRLLEIPSQSIREKVLRVLALTGLASFPFQIGYTASSLGHMLRDAGFDGVSVSNHVNLRDGSAERARTLRRVQRASRILHGASLGAVALGPWIEICCSKVAEPLARGDEAFSLALA